MMLVLFVGEGVLYCVCVCVCVCVFCLFHEGDHHTPLTYSKTGTHVTLLHDLVYTFLTLQCDPIDLPYCFYFIVVPYYVIF